MSRKDYKAFAALLKSVREDVESNASMPAEELTGALDVLDTLTDGIAGIFARDNSRFDSDKFNKASR